MQCATKNSFVKSVICTKNRNQTSDSNKKNLILAYRRPKVKKQKKLVLIGDARSEASSIRINLGIIIYKKKIIIKLE